MRAGIKTFILKFIVNSVLVLFLSVLALLFIAGNGIPFIEGDDKVTSGEGYNFKIGMTKPEVFKKVKTHYNKKDYYLRTLWLKESKINKQLESFQNTEWQEYPHRKYSEYKIRINELNEITLPLEYGGRWDIDLPAERVNSIYLTFEDERLIEIQKSRWLFERP